MNAPSDDINNLKEETLLLKKINYSIKVPPNKLFVRDKSRKNNLH